MQSQQTGEKISIRPSAKRILFQVGYEEKGLNARVELLRRFGHEVISVTHNEAAKVALSSFRNVDLFIVDYAAPERTRKEMVVWLKANYPKVKIIALKSLRGTDAIHTKTTDVQDSSRSSSFLNLFSASVWLSYLTPS